MFWVLSYGQGELQRANACKPQLWNSTEANLYFQLGWYNQITLWNSHTDAAKNQNQRR